MTDQYFWAERLARLGVLGPRVRPLERKVPELTEAFRAIVTNATLRENAQALKSAIRGDGVARMVAALETPAA